jgi:polyisoprenyl-phosphate glycosyltransferase
MKILSVIIPCFNEEDLIDKIYLKLKSLKIKKINLEMLFVDDGSSDQTLQKIKLISKKDKKVAFVSLSRNFGKEIAMLAGFDNCTGDAAVVIDADMQDPPELILEMIKFWQEGFDDVYARRVDRKGETWFKKISSKIFYRLLQKSSDFPIQVDVGDFRLLDRKCIDALTKMRENQRYTKGMYAWVGFRKKEITYVRQPRKYGRTKYNFSRMCNHAIDGLTSFSTKPLRLVMLFGLLISLIALIFVIVVVVKTLMFGDRVAGYPSLMAVVLFLGGVQLISLGIIGEYLGRVFNETKNRPLYFVQESKINNKH